MPSDLGNVGAQPESAEAASPDLPSGPQVEDVLSSMTLLLTRLTHQVSKVRVPPPAKFQWGLGRPLEDFLAEFQIYAKDHYGSQPQRWISHLPSFFEPPLSSLCDTLVRSGSSYEVITSSLLEAYGSLTTPRTAADAVREFHNCKYDPHEGIRGLVSRLRVLAIRAYGGMDEQDVEELVKQQCLSVLPGKLRQALYFQNLANPGMSLSEVIRIGSGLQDASLPAIPEVAVASASAPPSNGATLQRRTSGSRRGAQQRRPCNCASQGRSPDECDHVLNRCFRCHQVGHYISQCPQRPPSRQQARNFQHSGDMSDPPSTSSRVSAPSASACPFCGEVGHFMRSCTHFKDFLKASIENPSVLN